jgi:hypothetical protein
MTMTPSPALDHRRQYGAATPQRRKQRAPDLHLDLGLVVMLEGLSPDRAAYVVDAHV